VRPTPAKLFLVGDPKQSIYRFRRRRTLYESVSGSRGAGAEVVHLTVSPGVPDIQSVVNAAFARCMDGTSDGEAATSRSSRSARTSTRSPPSWRSRCRNRTAISGDRGFRIDDSLPDAVGVVDCPSQRLDSDGARAAGERIPVARATCVCCSGACALGRRRTRPYVRVGTPARHVLVGGSSFRKREEVRRSDALAAIERPDDALAVFATLAGRSWRSGTGSCSRTARRTGTRIA
jgi:hypothetical protein